MKRMSMIDKNMAQSYYLVWVQCSYTMRTKVDTKNKYAVISRAINVLGLLGFIKEFSYHYEGHRQVAHSLYEDHHTLSTLYQGRDAMDQDFLDIFKTNVAVFYQIEDTGMGSNNALTKAILRDRDENDPGVVTKGR